MNCCVYCMCENWVILSLDECVRCEEMNCRVYASAVRDPAGCERCVSWEYASRRVRGESARREYLSWESERRRVYAGRM